MKSIKKLLGAACSAATLALTLTTANVEGSGFSILEQSTAGLGRALAGMTCDINEPSAVFFNPSLSSWHERPALRSATAATTAAAGAMSRTSTLSIL